MKTAVALAILLATVSAARADDVQPAYAAVNDLFREEGGGLVSRQALCPKKNNENWGYATSATVAAIDDKDSAVLVDALQCSGGNLHGQFLVVVQAGSAHVVRDIGIGDMSFIADRMEADGDKLFLYGYHWLDSDGHCCPSKRATLEYDLKSGRHKLTVVGNNKS
jgi:hypothetical protein